MTCGTCPPAVTQTLRSRVDRELQKLASLISMTDFFNKAFGTTAGVAVQDVQSAVDAIPTPSPLDFLGILAYVTCPLTPLALGVGGIEELTDLDPEAQSKRIQNLGTGEIDDARKSYEDILGNSVNAKLVKQARKYEQTLRRLNFTAASFAEALIISASVQIVCGQDEFEEGPFQEFAQLADGFSFTGGVPGTLDQNLAALIQRLQAGELKFKALRETLV